MKSLRRCIFILLTSTALAAAAELPFSVEIDYSAAPECETFAKKSKTLCEEWYPKVNELLFGKDRPLPTKLVRLTFRPMKGVAHATHDGIHISAEWVTKKAPTDYGMVVHELTHIVQAYKGKGEGWLTEGIADYVRDKHFEPGVRNHRIDPDKHSFTNSYGIAAAFLIWLEERYDKQLVRKLNIAVHGGSYTREMFKQLCGKPLDDLWREFADTFRKP